jgi:hypothetical protein
MDSLQAGILIGVLRSIGTPVPASQISNPWREIQRLQETARAAADIENFTRSNNLEADEVILGLALDVIVNRGADTDVADGVRELLWTVSGELTESRDRQAEQEMMLRVAGVQNL